MATLSKSPKRKARRVCVFCGEADEDEDMFGKLLSKANLTAHYFCMLFASGLSQNGKSEKQGILGFLPADITKEVRRAARLRCSYCKKIGATIGCVMKNCKKMFHLGCGRRNDTLHQFFDTFCSYCPSHRPQQEVVASDDPSGSCSICMNALTPAPGVDTLQAPCCKRDWYHRTCIQRYANSAGLYFFKCPLCNNKEDFQHTMLTFGIYIPDQDASWETEPHAFQELLERYRHCDAAVCKCAEGRKYDKDGTKWEIILCEDCGSAGSHVACGHLVKVRKRDLCTECYAIDQKVKLEKKIKKQTPEKRKSLEMPFLEPALSPEAEKQTGSQYPGPSGKMRKKGLPQQGQMSPEYTCPLLSPQDYTTVNAPRMKMTPKSKSVSGGSKKAMYESMSGNNCKATKASKFKKCETQTYAMYTAEHNNTVGSDSSDDGLSLNEIKNKIKGSGKLKSTGGKKRHSEILPCMSTSTGDKPTSAGGKLRRDSLPGMKRKYKRRSGEPDSAQTSITRWFKARPADSKRLSLPSVPNDASQTSIIKWFKNRSSHLDNIGSQPISQPVVPHQAQTKKPYKRPKTVEWKGKQLLIKSPRVVLKKDSRLGKLKPRNLTIDMNDRKGSENDLLDMLDTDVRLTRNTNLADITVKKPKNLIIDMNNQSGHDLLTMIDSDVRLTRKKVQTEILPKTNLSGLIDVSPKKSVTNVKQDSNLCSSPTKKIGGSNEMKEMTTQTPIETELEFPLVGQTHDKDEDLESNFSQDSEITFNIKNKVTKPTQSDRKLQNGASESLSRSHSKKGRKSTANKQSVTDSSTHTSTLSTFSSAESAESTRVCKSNRSPRQQKLGHEKDGIKLYFEAEVNNNKVNDSPAKNLRNLKKRNVYIMGDKIDQADSAVKSDWVSKTNMPGDNEEPQDFIMVDTSAENSSLMSKPTIIQLKEMLNARVKKLSNLTEAETTHAETLSPLRNKGEAAATVGLVEGEHTPTSQIHKAFDFSADKVNELSKKDSQSPILMKRCVKVAEAAGSGRKATNKMDKDKFDKVAIGDEARRNPRTLPKSCEKHTSGIAIPEWQLQKSVSHKAGVTVLGNDKIVDDSEESRNHLASSKIKAVQASHSPRSSPRFKSADSLRVTGDKPDSQSSSSLRKQGLWLVKKQEGLKRKLEAHEEADVTPTKRPLQSKAVSESVTQDEENSVVENSKLCADESLVRSSSLRDVPAQNCLSFNNVDKEIAEMNKVGDAEPQSFTKITPRRSPRKHADPEMGVSSVECKGVEEHEGSEKPKDTLSLLKAYKLDERLKKNKLAVGSHRASNGPAKQGRSNTSPMRSDSEVFGRSVTSPARSDSQGRCDKVLRTRTRSSLPAGASCEDDREADKSVVWVLPGTRQINTEKTGLPESVFEATSRENTNPNIDLSTNSIHNSLPLKKRKFISKLETNSDIQDFLGKSHSMFFNKPDGLLRSNSECSDASGVSEICTTALKLSPSYVTRFRRCHSKDMSDISQSVIQNLSTFGNDEGVPNTDKQNRINADTRSESSCLSDKIAMTDYYKGAKSIVKARGSMESMSSFSSNDSDLMIISPIVGENIIEIV